VRFLSERYIADTLSYAYLAYLRADIAPGRDFARRSWSRSAAARSP
jgi:hypothetical protein